MQKIKYTGSIRNITAVLFTALMLIAAWFEGRAFAADEGLSVENVKVDKKILRPNESVRISFQLTSDADVTVQVYDPDYSVVRNLLVNQRRPAGVNVVTWDGTDDSGVMVPDEAYIIAIAAEGSGGLKAVYDPTLNSGGEIIDFPASRIETASGAYIINYFVPRDARISIMAGIHNGPMLRNILDWKPKPAGNASEQWDGMDETGQINVMSQQGNTLNIRGFQLPENSIIVQGSGGDYNLYHARIASQAEKAPIISYTTARQNAAKRADREIAVQFPLRQGLNTAPKFSVYLGQDRKAALSARSAAEVSGQVGFTVAVPPENLPLFNESRYELVVFVDNKRFDEEEQAYSPYTYYLDTTQLTDGEHMVTLNFVGIAGQIGSSSFKISVNNKGRAVQ